MLFSIFSRFRGRLLSASMVAVQPTPKLIMESTTILRAASYRHSPSSSTRSYHYYYRRKSVARAVKHPRRPTAKMTPSSISLADVPCSVRDMDNISLSTLSKQDNHVQALEEMLKRHIMKVDKVDYHQACLVLEEIEKVNHKWEHFMALPFQIAILTCGAGALLAFPLVFHLPTVEYFNEYYVTAEHPQPKELETWLEVGSWSWNWMEPILGTSTFVLLCLQYMRIHLNHLGVQPFTYRMKLIRAKNLLVAFPRYNRDLLTSYSQATPFYDTKHLWV